MNGGINAYSVNQDNVSNTSVNDNLFSNVDFGPMKKYLDDDNITDISYSNNGQVWLKSLDKGVYREENSGIDNDLIEKIAFQCANIMGKTFNMASPFLDSESAELRMNFVHDSIARNGIACVFRKTPAKIRLQKEKLLETNYITLGIHDFLIQCVKGHCNIMVAGETGSGKTELIKYLASHTAENEKIITIEDTLELHLDRIFPKRDIVAMKTNNIASYSDVLVTCMRQNPKWILLSEVRSAEAVTAVRNAISSGHYILSTIHADKAQSIPHRMYSLLESNIDVEQFMTTIYRYIQIGIYVRARYDKERGFMRELAEVCEFYVNEKNEPEYNVIYKKNIDGTEINKKPSQHLITYLANQGVDLDTSNLKDDGGLSIEEALNDESSKPEEQLVEEETPVSEPNLNATPEPPKEEKPDLEILSDDTESLVFDSDPLVNETVPTEPVAPAPTVPQVEEHDLSTTTSVSEENNNLINLVDQPVQPTVPVETVTPVPTVPIVEPSTVDQVVNPVPAPAAITVEEEPSGDNFYGDFDPDKTQKLDNFVDSSVTTS